MTELHITRFASSPSRFASCEANNAFSLTLSDFRRPWKRAPESFIFYPRMVLLWNPPGTIK